MPKYHPDHVRLMLSYAAPANSFGDRTLVLEAEFADSGDPIFRLPLLPGQFVDLMASRSVAVRSAVEVPRGPGPACQETDRVNRGDCDGGIREFAVTNQGICGQLRGDLIMLCANHAQHHADGIRIAGGLG